jgi:hypothetical protein
LVVSLPATNLPDLGKQDLVFVFEVLASLFARGVARSNGTSKEAKRATLHRRGRRACET